MGRSGVYWVTTRRDRAGGRRGKRRGPPVGMVRQLRGSRQGGPVGTGHAPRSGCWSPRPGHKIAAASPGLPVRTLGARVRCVRPGRRRAAEEPAAARRSERPRGLPAAGGAAGSARARGAAARAEASAGRAKPRSPLPGGEGSGDRAGPAAGPRAPPGSRESGVRGRARAHVSPAPSRRGRPGYLPPPGSRALPTRRLWRSGGRAPSCQWGVRPGRRGRLPPWADWPGERRPLETKAEAHVRRCPGARRRPRGSCPGGTSTSPPPSASSKVPGGRAVLGPSREAAPAGGQKEGAEERGGGHRGGDLRGAGGGVPPRAPGAAGSAASWRWLICSP